jgi:hypothetical protein
VSGEKRCKGGKSVLDYLIAILNYFRYLYKIIMIVEDTNSNLITASLKRYIKSTIIVELMRSFEKHEAMARSQENIYEFSVTDWDEFRKGRKWCTFFGVVEQYSQKYRKLFEK